MKRKIAALMIALFLLCALLPAALGSDSVYFLAVNDKIVDYTPSTVPIVSSGTVYVPYTTFLSEGNGGVNLGVFYGQDKQLNTLSLYGKQKPIITFDIAKGTTYDTMERLYPYRALVRNHTIYLPAWAVCNYFDLEYSLLNTGFGPLIRIKNEGGYYLDDRFFVSSASDKLREQKKKFEQGQVEELPSLPPSPTPSAQPEPEPEVPENKRVRVSLGIRCDSGEGPLAVLNQLEWKGEKAIFFFRPGHMAQWDDEIRRLLAQGHRIGFLVDGETVSACQNQAEEGNRLLSHIARTRTDYLLVEGGPALRRRLKEAGWACWTGHLTGRSYSGSGSSELVSALMEELQKRNAATRLLLEDSARSAQALGRLIPQLNERGWPVFLPPESSL